MILNNPEAILPKEIGRNFKLKEKYVGAPSQYLGGNLRQVKMDNGQECWDFGSTQYVCAAVENFDEYLEKKGKKISAKALTTISSKYLPEVEISKELSDEEVYYYHYLIGVLRWILELSRAVICVEVSMMFSHLALP